MQDFGLTTSEVESVLGSCDLESLVSSSGMATPRAELNNLGRYFEQVLFKIVRYGSTCEFLKSGKQQIHFQLDC